MTDWDFDSVSAKTESKETIKSRMNANANLNLLNYMTPRRIMIIFSPITFAASV